MQHLHFSSETIRPALRREAIRDAWAENMQMDVDLPECDCPFFDLSGCDLAGLWLGAFQGSAARIYRTEAQARRAPDNVIICLSQNAHVRTTDANGRQRTFNAAGAHVWKADRRMACDVDGDYRALLLSLPTARLVRMGIDIDAIIDHGGLGDLSGELRLLWSYAAGILGECATLDDGTTRLATDHLFDLILLVLSRSRQEGDGRQVSALRAARLQAIKSDITAHFSHPGFSAEWVAARHSMTSRYMRRLFEETGASFSDYVLELRLNYARKLLINPALAGRSISSIAYECGFGDLSYFNRVLRRRFGMTPTDMRRGQSAV